MGILKVGVAVAVVAGIGLGLALGWGLNELTRGPLRSESGLRPREEEEAQEPGPGEPTAAAEPAQPAETPHLAMAINDLRNAGSLDCRRSEAWARRRQEHVKSILGEETFSTLEALIRWCWGAPVEEARAGLSLGRSGFYWRLEQVLTRLPSLLEDGRCHNGRRRAQAEGGPQIEVAEVKEEVAGQIVDLVVGWPGLSPAEVNQRIQEQDGTRIDPQRIADSPVRAGLAHHGGSLDLQEALPAVSGNEGSFSRYAAQLLTVPALQQLGLYEAAPLLEVDGEGAFYGPVVRCHTLLFALSCGKSRIFQVGELVEDEFGRLLGEVRYPQRSELHGWLDRIVARDQIQVQEGLPREARMVGRFVGLSQQLLARTAPDGAGRSIYVDLHTIVLHTAKPVPKARHGMSQRIVKALVKVRAVSADPPGRPLSFNLEPGDRSLHQQLEAAVAWTAWVTGEPVEMVGVDRGGLSQAALERFEESEIGLAVWADDTPTVRQQLAQLPREAFSEREYETVRQLDGCKVQRLKSRLADVADMAINAEGYRCRTVVVEDAKSGHRAGIHVVGPPARSWSARSILAFMRGKQWVEEEFKQEIRWGGDRFCGGEVFMTLRRERPEAKEVEEIKEKARKLKGRWRDNRSEEAAAVNQWQAGQCAKRQLNDLLKGIRRRRQRIESDWEEAEALIRWGRTGVVPDREMRWVVDTRKMMLVNQLRDFARLAHKDTMSLVRQFLKQALVESSTTERGIQGSPREQSVIEQEAQRSLERVPWKQMETRLFDQGGWVYKDRERRVMAVTLKPFGNRLMRRACERLCKHLNHLQPVMRCRDGDYALHYTMMQANPPP